MRAKLEQIAAGKIEYERPAVKFSEQALMLSCKPGEELEGSFAFSSSRLLKGVAYASSERMSFKHPSFHSRNVRLFYLFDARGFAGGEEIQGEFSIVTDAGEFLLPYTVRVEAPGKTREEGYAYFVFADPIEPLPKRGEVQESKTQIWLNSEKAERERVSRASEKELFESCSLRIKNGEVDRESFLWYRRGVLEELKITNLYEYFMLSAPEDYGEAFPRNLLLYFQMENNTLNSHQKALLYANVIKYQEEDSQIYQDYRDSIEEFMLEELLKRRQSENLAVIYERFLVEQLLTIDFAEALADILFLRRISCSDRRIRQVQVLYDQLQEKITVPLVGGQALIPVYTPGAVIALVDAQGNCYASSVPYTLKRLMDERRYAGRCQELLHYHQGLYLYLCDGASKSHVITSQNVENYKRVLKINGFTARYKEDVRQEILQFYYAGHELEELDREFFVAETASMTPKDRAKYTEILILRGLYEEAYDSLRKFGYALVRVKLLIKLAAYRIRETGYEENEFLLKLCLFIFRQHKYNESILEYLSGYYYGSARTMEAVWQEARAFEVNVFDLEERLLGQMLFTGEFLESAFEIFKDYHSLGGEGLAGRAYLTWLAYEDFVRGKPAPKGAYDYLEQAIAWEENLADVCGLAYLNDLTLRRHLNEHQRIRAERMVKDYIERKMRFSFMKPLMERLGKPYMLEDKTFVEYRANPNHRVVLHYVVETPRERTCSYMAERLYPVEPGLFVREFTLFYGERLTWFVTEVLEDGTEISTPDVSYTEEREEPLLTGTKYADIYELARSLSERDMAEFERRMENYGRKNFLIETVFSLK